MVTAAGVRKSTRTRKVTGAKEEDMPTAKMLATIAAFDYAEKALAGVAQKAGFKDEAELQEYVKNIRRCR